MDNGPASQPMGYPPEPPQAPPPLAPPPRSSTRMIVVLLLLSVLSAGICAGVLLYIREGRKLDAELAAAHSAEASEAKTMRAVVKLPDGQTKAVMRQRAAFDAPVVVLLPAGTAVEVTNSTTAKGQTWCRVRTIDFQPAASGWMHADVLQFP